jgi:methanogenic corrinoid protein MtbC1
VPPRPAQQRVRAEQTAERATSEPRITTGTVPGTAYRAGAAAELQSPPVTSVRAFLAVAPWAAIVVAAGVGAVVSGVSVLGGVCVAVLLCASAALGWSAGKVRRAALAREADHSSHELRRASSELEIAQKEMVKRLSMAVEYRDEDTGAHIERIGRLSTMLAEQIGMESDWCARLTLAAPLHDVGKVAIPDAILLKPGPLTPEERAIIETHAEEGYRLLRGSSSSVLELAASIALSHQEKWDGTGYPRGLVGEAIPIEGRIVAIADVFDALTTDRVYRGAFPVEEAIRMMSEQRGKHFDPVLLDAFMEVLGRAGADARGDLRSDPGALAEQTLETFGSALERDDAETAEAAIASAIDDGLPPAALHTEVIAPALRRTHELRLAGEIDEERERRAKDITKRVLATLARYMIGNREPTRERVLVAGVRGDEHTLELHMIHDQLAAAGYATSFAADVVPALLAATIEEASPDVVVIGAVPDAHRQQLDHVIDALHASGAKVPLVLGGLAAGGSAPEVRDGELVLERIDEAVAVVQDALTERA